MTVMELEPQDPWKHRLLANLNEEDRRRLIPHMEKVFVLPREIIYWPSRPIDFIYFPLSAVFSLVGTTKEGDTVEIGQVGDEAITEVGEDQLRRGRDTSCRGLAVVAEEGRVVGERVAHGVARGVPGSEAKALADGVAAAPEGPQPELSRDLLHPLQGEGDGPFVVEHPPARVAISRSEAVAVSDARIAHTMSATLLSNREIWRRLFM